MSRPVNVGLVGLGTIGTGVARLFYEQCRTFDWRCSGPVILRRIADLDPSDRGIAIPAGVLATDVAAVLDDPGIDIVVELIGGIEPARRFILRAIENGKHVVSANKALLSTHGEEIFRAAADRGVDVLFEASVGGSIPILRSLRTGLQTSRFESIYGILNGTTNYILTRMADEGASYADMLRSAQQAGFAERDPTADVTGRDSLQKLVILLRLAFNIVVRPEDVLCEGIERITPSDIAYAREFGYAIKLLAIAKRRGDRIEARVHPAMIPDDCVMASVKYEYNAIEVVGAEFGTQVFYGKGAGQRPTATVVVSDVLDIAGRIQCGIACGRSAELLHRDGATVLVPPDDLRMRHYVRLDVADQAGVLSEIARALAAENVSIESVIQKGRSAGETVPLVIMTHEAPESALRRAVANIERLEVVGAPVQRIRVEDLA